MADPAELLYFLGLPGHFPRTIVAGPSNTWTVCFQAVPKRIIIQTLTPFPSNETTKWLPLTIVITRGCTSYHHTVSEKPQLANLYSKLIPWFIRSIKSENSLWSRRHGHIHRIPWLTTLPNITETGYIWKLSAQLQPLFWLLQNFLLNFWHNSFNFLITDTLPSCRLTSLHWSSLLASSGDRRRYLIFWGSNRRNGCCTEA